MKIITILGARPQFVKAAMLSKELAKYKNVHEAIVHTGQHFDDNMSKVFFDEMGIPKPAYHLNINSMSHGAMTGRMLEEIEKILLQEKPDLLIVYGDTNSTVAGSLAAAKLQIPVAHVEAGIRAGYYLPEEVNRMVTDQLSDYLFAPSESAKACLLGMSFDANKVHNVGDIMYDAVLHFSNQASEDLLPSLGLEPDSYVLVTLHREENVDNPERLQILAEQLIQLSKKIKVILPLHPRTAKRLKDAGLFEEFSKHVQCIEPQPYVNTLGFINNARLVLTDSGGLQKEVFYLDKPVYVLKQATEWAELLESPLATLIKPKDYARINEIVDLDVKPSSSQDFYPYGKGNTAQLITDILLASIGKK